MKYRPDYPTRFGCLQDASAWAAEFFNWYNREHHHTGLALLTPADVHFCRADDLQQKRQAVLQAAYAKTPERFVKGAPYPIPLPKAVWINPPRSSTTAARALFPFRLGQLQFYTNLLYKQSLRWSD